MQIFIVKARFRFRRFRSRQALFLYPARPSTRPPGALSRGRTTDDSLSGGAGGRDAGKKSWEPRDTQFLASNRMKRFLVTVLTSQLAVQSTSRHLVGNNGAPFHPLARPYFGASSRRRRQTDREYLTTSPTDLPRGGDAASTAATTEQSLDDRVDAAMRRLGLADEEEMPAPESPDVPDGVPDGVTCEDGVCTVDEQDSTSTHDDSEATAVSTQEEMFETADRLSADMNVPKDLALAAIYSSFATDSEGNMQINENGARDILQAELDAIAGVSEDSEPCKQLVSEGYDPFLARRALAVTESNVENARAILVADQEDEEAEAAAYQAEMEAQQKEEEAAPMKTVTVDYPQNFDPVANQVASPEPKKPDGAPPKARREDVIFEGTTGTIQELVIESPVPVLLDVYAGKWELSYLSQK